MTLNPYLHRHHMMFLQTVSVIAFIVILNYVYYAGKFLSLSSHYRELGVFQIVGVGRFWRTGQVLQASS